MNRLVIILLGLFATTIVFSAPRSKSKPDFIDRSFKAPQQTGPTCWAFGCYTAVVLAKKAKEKEPTVPVEPPALPSEVSPQHSNMFLSPQRPQANAGSSISDEPYVLPPAEGVFKAERPSLFPNLLGGAKKEKEEPPPKSGPKGKNYRPRALFKNHFDGNSPQGTIALAKKAGWGKDFTFRNYFGIPGRRMGNQETLKFLKNGMEHGVRFEAFYHVHAMAIIGVDLKRNTIIVTDSARGGKRYHDSLRNIRMDAILAVASRENKSAMKWMQTYKKPRRITKENLMDDTETEEKPKPKADKKLL